MDAKRSGRSFILFFCHLFQKVVCPSRDTSSTMLNIVGHVLALARFLEENPEQKGYHKGFLNERLRAEVKDLATYQTADGTSSATIHVDGG